MSPFALLISACRPDIDESLTEMSHWSDRPMVSAIFCIGYDFSRPEGALTMKFALTPSSSAGSIISVFGLVVSTAIAFFRDDLRSKLDIQRTGEPSRGQGAASVPDPQCRSP